MNKILMAIVGALGAGAVGAIIKHKTKNAKDGYDIWGYDKDGYYKDGYDLNGYDKDGFDRKGFDKDGYDKDGFDKDGYDRSGYDKEGYDDHYRYNDYYRYDDYNDNPGGYNREGYNRLGLDMAHRNKQFYRDEINKLRESLNIVKLRTKSTEDRQVVYNIKFVFEEALRLLVKHKEGYNDNKSLDNLNNLVGHNNEYSFRVCHAFNEAFNKEFDKDTVDKLYSIRRICDKNLHKFENGEPLDYTTIQFVIEQDKNLLDKVEKVLWLV